MGEIKDIIDRKSLEAWLNALPQQTEEDRLATYRFATSLAFRAVVRVLPVWWDAMLKSHRVQDNELSTLPPFRCLLTALVAVREDTINFNAVCRASVNAARSADSTTAYLLTTGGAGVVDVSLAARSVVNIAARSPNSFGAVVTAAAIAVDSALTSSVQGVLPAFHRDCQMVLNQSDVLSTELWPEENPLQDSWEHLQSYVDKEEWAFWIDWYNRLVSGSLQSINDRMMVEIALLPDALWQDEPAALKRINEIWERYKSEGHLETQSELQATPSSQTHSTKLAMRNNRRTLPPTFEAITSMIALELDRLHGRNFQSDSDKKEVKRQVNIYLSLAEAIETLRSNLPEDGQVTDEQAEVSISTLRLYREKALQLPRSKVDEVIEGTWAATSGLAQFGIIHTISTLAISYGAPALAAYSVAALCVAPGRAKEIISAVKDSVTKGAGG